MKTLEKIITKQQIIPILRCVGVKDGVGMATDLENALYFSTTLPDGVYTKDLRPTEGDLRDFPEPPKMTGEKIVGTLSKSEITFIANISRACSRDNTRPAITGVCFDGHYAVATDGYQANITLTRLHFGEYLPIIRRTAIELLKPLLDDGEAEEITVSVNGDNDLVRFRCGTVYMDTEPIDYQYPKWREFFNH